MTTSIQSSNLPPANVPRIEDVIHLHDIIVRDVGGAKGLRSRDALASALARVDLRMQYDPEITVVQVAACTAVSIAKSHAFSDGNKRAAYGAMRMVLAMNGRSLMADTDQSLQMIISAATQGDEELLAGWLEQDSPADPVYQALFDYDLDGPSAP